MGPGSGGLQRSDEPLAAKRICPAEKEAGREPVKKASYDGRLRERSYVIDSAQPLLTGVRALPTTDEIR